MTASAGSSAVPGPGATDATHAGVSAPIVLPIEYSDRHIFVTFEDERQHPLTFLLDTGFENSALTRAAAGNRYIMWLGETKLKGYGGKAPERWFGKSTVVLRTGQVNVFSGTVLVLDRDFIQSQIEHPADGILGWDVFSQWCSTLDVGARRLTLRPRSECSTPPDGGREIQHDWMKQGLLVPAAITFAPGRKARTMLRLDTGCDTALVLNPQFREIAGIGRPGVAARPIDSWGVNGTSTADRVTVSSIELDGGAIRIPGSAQPTVVIQREGAVARSHLWNTKEAKVSRDGLLGMELLERFTWTFDPEGKKVYIASSAGKTPE
ncbi:MAG TPA: hypothetical protein VKB38_10440 [Terracidiphilus sp.]|nr:hypothetical protein [Terracidiphilus sp.]